MPAQVSPAAAMNLVVCLFPNELYRGAFDVTHEAVFITRGPQGNVYDHAYAGTSLNKNCPFILLWGYLQELISTASCLCTTMMCS